MNIAKDDLARFTRNARLWPQAEASMFFLAVVLALGAVAAYWASQREAEKDGDTVSARRWEKSVFYRDDEFVGWVTSGASSLQGLFRNLL